MINLAILRQRYRKGFLSTPYQLYEGGPEAAAAEAAKIAGELLLEGVKVFSPIVHGHQLVKHCNDIDATDNEFWAEVNLPDMEDSDYLLIAEMKGWKDSSGIAEEKDWFQSAGRPVYYLNPMTLEVR